jgi:hypothetical protein
MDACWDDVPTVSDDYARARDSIRAHVAAMIEQMLAQSKSQPLTLADGAKGREL